MEEYKISDKIKEYTKNGDINALRDTLVVIINRDKGFNKGTFDNSYNYIYENIGESKKNKIYDDLVGEIYTINKKDKDLKDDDFKNALLNLDKNFCEQRFREVKRIGKALYGYESKKNSMDVKQISYTKKPCTIKKKKKSGKLVIMVIVVLLIGIIFGIGNIIKIVLKQDVMNQETQQDTTNQENMERK